jgi:hypothetical protein
MTAARFDTISLPYTLGGWPGYARPWLARDLRARESIATAIASTSPVITKRYDEFRSSRVSPLAIDSMTRMPISAENALPRPPKRLLFWRLDGDRSPSVHQIIPTRLIARGSGEIAP